MGVVLELDSESVKTFREIVDRLRNMPSAAVYKSLAAPENQHYPSQQALVVRKKFPDVKSFDNTRRDAADLIIKIIGEEYKEPVGFSSKEEAKQALTSLIYACSSRFMASTSSPLDYMLNKGRTRAAGSTSVENSYTFNSRLKLATDDLLECAKKQGIDVELPLGRRGSIKHTSDRSK
jgi:hypothetical protein